MKKIIASVSFLLIALVSCDKKDENATFYNDLKSYNLKGNVKSIEEKSYEVIGDGKSDPKRESSASFDFDLEFDQNHQLIAEKSYRSDGKLFNLKTFEHKNKMLSEKETLPENDYTTTYTFDGNNNTIITKRDKDGKQLHKTVNTFEKGWMTQKRLFNNNDQLIERFTYKYDAKGNVLEASKHNEYELLYTDLFSYDSKNKKVSESRIDKTRKSSYKISTRYKDTLITEIQAYDGDGIMQSSETRSYDKSGNIIKKTYEDIAFKEKSSETNKYDQAGNLTEWVQFVNDKKFQAITYSYDKYKNITSIKRLDQNDVEVENKFFKYEYDKEGNWITKAIYNKGIQTFILVRKIQYF